MCIVWRVCVLAPIFSHLLSRIRRRRAVIGRDELIKTRVRVIARSVEGPGLVKRRSRACNGVSAGESSILPSLSFSIALSRTRDHRAQRSEREATISFFFGGQIRNYLGRAHNYNFDVRRKFNYRINLITNESRGVCVPTHTRTLRSVKFSSVSTYVDAKSVAGRAIRIRIDTPLLVRPRRYLKDTIPGLHPCLTRKDDQIYRAGVAVSRNMLSQSSPVYFIQQLGIHFGEDEICFARGRIYFPAISRGMKKRIAG